MLLPIAAYAILIVSAIAAPSHTHEALFGVGASALLLFIGIHIAWDNVSYHVFVNTRDTKTQPGTGENSVKEKSGSVSV